VAAVVAYALVTLPSKRIALTEPLPNNVVFGAYHVHSTRSDGSATPDAIAAAARRAGLTFVVLTDHGDGTRAPDAPRYVDGVLLIDAVEISTNDGHVVALGLPRAATYPLAGEARDVIEDIHRQGGFAIVAHPDSPKPELRWRAAPARGGGAGGRGGAGVELAGADGLEWLSADTEWRDDSLSALVNTALHLPIRPAESMMRLFDRPIATLRRWDALARRRPVVGLAASDAHGFHGWFYESAFRSFAQAAWLERAPTGDAAVDAASLLTAISSGRTFSILSGIAGPVVPDFRASDGAQSAVMGQRIVTAALSMHVTGGVKALRNARVVLIHNERPLREGAGEIAFDGPAAPGVYRLEIWMGESRVPWIVTNPIYVEAPAAATPALPAQTDRAPAVSLPLVPGAPAWMIEHGPSSTGRAAMDGTALRFEYSVGTAQPGLEFAAAVRSMGDGVESFDRLEFVARADRPMRVSIQLRFPGGRDGERWARSVFLDSTPRPVVVRMEELQPVGFSATRRPIVARVKSLLLVVDTVNTATGSSGTIWVDQMKLLKTAEPGSGANGQEQVGRAGQEQQIRRPGRENRRQ
jgi:hypothetical protein